MVYNVYCGYLSSILLECPELIYCAHARFPKLASWEA